MKASQHILNKACNYALYFGWSFDECKARWSHLTREGFYENMKKIPYTSITARHYIKVTGKRHYVPKTIEIGRSVYFNKDKVFYNESDNEFLCGTQNLHVIFAQYKYDEKLKEEERLNHETLLQHQS